MPTASLEQDAHYKQEETSLKNIGIANKGTTLRQE